MGSNLSRDYVPGIDGLRAIAVLAVMLFHMDALPSWRGGFTGVDVFFVISGYVICTSLSSRPERSPRDFILSFYKRRLVRIAPALLAMLLVVTLASVLFIPSSWMSRAIDETGLSAFFGYSNFRLALDDESYFSPRLELNPFLHSWSLGLEEQFYLIFPVVFLFRARRGGKDRESRGGRVLGALARHSLAILACASLAIAILQSSASGKLAYYLLPSRFWELALGALLAQAHNVGRLVSKSAGASTILVATGLALALVGFLRADQAAFPFPWALLPTAGAAMTLCGIAGRTGESSPLAKILASPVMSYVGKLSYSLYLWHWPVAALFRWTFGFSSAFSKALYVLVSFVLATASYHLVETPIRRSAFIKRQGSLRVVAASLAIVVVSFLAARFLWSSRNEISLSATRDVYAWHSREFKGDGPASPITEDPGIRGRRLFAVGDSHASAYRTMLAIVSRELGIEVHEYEEGDCAVPSLLKPLDGRTEAHYRKALCDIERLARPGDVVFLAALRMPTFADNFEAADVDEIARTFLGEAAARDRKLALDEASSIIDSFARTGACVVMEAPLPVLLAPPYRCSDWFNRMNPVGANGLTVSRSFLEELRAPVMESIRALSAGREDFFVWDPFSVLCPREVFSAFDDGGRPIFWDGDHLSGNGNRILAPSFREFLISLWTRRPS